MIGRIRPAGLGGLALLLLLHGAASNAPIPHWLVLLVVVPVLWLIALGTVRVVDRLLQRFD